MVGELSSVFPSSLVFYVTPIQETKCKVSDISIFVFLPNPPNFPHLNPGLLCFHITIINMATYQEPEISIGQRQVFVESSTTEFSGSHRWAVRVGEKDYYEVDGKFMWALIG